MISLLQPIDELELTKPAEQFLKSNMIFYVSDVHQRSRKELLALPGSTLEHVLEIDLALRRKGKLLGAKLDNWPPKKSGTT